MKHLFIQCKTELFFFARHVLFATATSIYIRSSGIVVESPAQDDWDAYSKFQAEVGDSIQNLGCFGGPNKM